MRLVSDIKRSSVEAGSERSGWEKVAASLPVEFDRRGKEGVCVICGGGLLLRLGLSTEMFLELKMLLCLT